jgi:pyruvate,water dikinase
MIYDNGESLTKIVDVPIVDQQFPCINDDDILTLAKWSLTIEEHYSNKKGKWTPQDIEWAKDGISGQLFIVQARPETVQSQQKHNTYKTYQLKSKGKAICTGKSVGTNIKTGKASIIKEINESYKFSSGDVLVTHRTDPAWEPIMKRASAIITNTGGRTCHAAIIARELGIPAIVGCNDATSKITQNEELTVDCSGEDGVVYKGILPFSVEEVNIAKLSMTKTKLMMNVGNPREAFKLANIPCDGVGLARLEFIIANFCKAHPLALIHFDELQDPFVKAEKLRT